jgi:hypothetical protein
MSSEPNEPVTEVADTAIAAGENAKPSELAWSLDTEETSTHDHGWLGPVTSAGLVALVCVIVAVVTWFAITLYHQNDSRPAAQNVAPAPKPVAPVPPSAPPKPVAPEPPSAPPKLSDNDRAFLADLRQGGLIVPSEGYAISHAHATCDFMAVHEEGGILNFVETSTIWTHDVSARPFIETAVSYFCPQYADKPVGGIGAPEAEAPTTTAAAPTTTVPVMTETDQQFLKGLIGIGFPNPAYAISHAHALCDYRADHDQAAGASYIAATTVWAGTNAYDFEDTAEMQYCPQYLPADF